MRLYISADIEGIVHVTSAAHTMPGGFEYDSARRWMTDTVLAAIETAHAHGFDEVVVSDSHGNAQNILPDLMPDYVRLVRGWPRPLSMMQGIDDGAYDAAMLIGYHAGAKCMGGNFAHNFSGYQRRILVNGQTCTETTISAAVAGHFGVPVLLVSGDDVYCEEARTILPGVEAVAVKSAPGRHCSYNPSTAVAHARIRDGVVRALENRANVAPFTIDGPLNVRLAFRAHLHAEILALLPGIERVSAHEIEAQFDDILALASFIEFLGNYDLTKF